MNKMTYEEALAQAFSSEKRIRLLDWNDESYMEVIEGKVMMHLGGRVTECMPRQVELDSTEWVVLSKHN